MEELTKEQEDYLLEQDREERIEDDEKFEHAYKRALEERE